MKLTKLIKNRLKEISGTGGATRQLQQRSQAASDVDTKRADTKSKNLLGILQNQLMLQNRLHMIQNQPLKQENKQFIIQKIQLVET